MSKGWDVLVASANLEHRRELIRILEELPLNVISVSTFQQAEEVLSRQRIALMFSDQRLPDGSFRELMNHTHSVKQPPRVVLTTQASDSLDPHEMAECGVLGTVKYPFHATDVELQVIRAAHEELEEAPSITH
ncbi:MAG TPA: response regulator [Candidatus Dormibacteraeota bacterium]|nr:response regulator [Candidatus Dormibacteraeota bacterium]